MINELLKPILKFIKKFDFKKDFNSRDKVDFAIQLIEEEVRELREAFENDDVEEIVDALGDIEWLTSKMMLQCEVDPLAVRLEIGRANLSKERGIKPGREQSGGFDVIKPKDWIGPDHSDNHGILPEILNK